MKPMKYFQISELIAPEIQQILSLEACWLLIPAHVQHGLDRLRELYGARITINNSEYKYSGIRPQNCSVGATYSAHKVNRGLIGFDLKCSDLPKLRRIVADHFAELHIAETEHELYSPSWCHIAFSVEIPIKLKIIRP